MTKALDKCDFIAFSSEGMQWDTAYVSRETFIQSTPGIAPFLVYRLLYSSLYLIKILEKCMCNSLHVNCIFCVQYRLGACVHKSRFHSQKNVLFVRIGCMSLEIEMSFGIGRHWSSLYTFKSKFSQIHISLTKRV